MKTTIEISDPLLDEAKETALREGGTLRRLVEEGLRLALDRRETSPAFRLRDEAVGGNGLRGDLRGASWSEILDRSYEDRGA